MSRWPELQKGAATPLTNTQRRMLARQVLICIRCDPVLRLPHLNALVEHVRETHGIEGVRIGENNGTAARD